MNDLINAHGSLLGFISSLAEGFTASEGIQTTAINLDAVVDESDLPATDIVGLKGFALNSANREPLPVASGMIVMMTRDDPNNMRLIRTLNQIYNQLSPEQLLPLFNLQTGETIGDLKVVGTTRVMPSDRTAVMAVQGVVFQVALQRVA